MFWPHEDVDMLVVSEYLIRKVICGDGDSSRLRVRSFTAEHSENIA